MTKNLAVQATYAGSRGVHLLNTNHFNLTNPALGRRPDPNIGLIVYVEGSGRNNYNSLQLSANYRMSSRITGDLYYTFAKNLTYGATDSADGPRQNDIQDFSNMQASYGPKSGDIRHQLTGVGRSSQALRCRPPGTSTPASASSPARAATATSNSG